MDYSKRKTSKKTRPSFSGMVDYALKASSKSVNSTRGHYSQPRTTVNIRSASNAPATVRRHRPEYGLLVAALLLSLIGLIVINAVGPTLAQQIGRSSGYFIWKQLIFLIVGFIGFFFVSRLKLNTIRKHTVSALIISILLCFIIFIPGLGLRVNGAIRWFNLGPVSFQPSELLKLSLIIWGAYIFHELIKSEKLNDFNTLKRIYYPILILAVLAVGLLQKDWGTLMVLSAIIAIPLFVSGIDKSQLLRIGAIMFAAALLITIIFPYRLKRITAFLQKDDHSQTNNYHANQAQIGLGSGGIFGKGLGKSEQIFGYLPEAANDSIFAVIGEKFGFIGSVAILGIFGYLLRKMLYIMRRMPSVYTKTMVAGCFGAILGGVVVNIGSMIGLIPLLGVPLPLISFGGTSLVFTLMMLGLAFNLSRYTVLNR